MAEHNMKSLKHDLDLSKQQFRILKAQCDQAQERIRELEAQARRDGLLLNSYQMVLMNICATSDKAHSS